MDFIFPKDFVWGAGSSAYQIEASRFDGGKVADVYDHYSKLMPEKYSNTGPEYAADFYHNFREDIKLMGEQGLKSFRFSFSWARIQSEIGGPVNQAGIDYYNQVIDCLIENNVIPFFDLFHCDLPMFVIEAGGILNPDFIKWFTDYAKILFENFGDRVQYWSTVNEPSVNVTGGYYRGTAAPYVKDKASGLKAMLHMVLAHYSVCKLYHSMNLPGKIGMVNFCMPAYPKTQSKEDYDAAERYFAWHNQMWLDPFLKAEFPKIITDFPEIGDFMPENANEILKANYEPMDFLGINFYTAALIQNDPESDMSFKRLKYEALPMDEYTFRLYPVGMFDLLHRIKDLYGDIPLFISENGMGLHHKEDMEEDAHDPERVDYMREHIRMCARCIKSGINLKGYYHWTFLDTYEGTMGAYRFRFAMVQVDPTTKKRRPRDSYYYYKTIMANNTVD